MEKMLKKFTVFTLLLLIVGGAVFAGTDKPDDKQAAMKEFSIFLGRPNEDYPAEGTILGDWIEKKTGVRLNWEFPVGDLRQKIGLIIAGGEYPDMIDARNENRSLYDAGAYIPLDDLIEEYGVNVKKLYRDNLKMLKQDDGHIYWFPQLFPYGDKVQRTMENGGLYIQKAVLKEFGYPIPETLNEAMDMLIEYCKRHPEINGRKTVAFTALTYDWREFPLMNAPAVFSGHPNDGELMVDWVDGAWKVSTYYDKKEAYKVYKLYNKVFLAGLYDTESFVMDYDQYLAKLSTGSVLAFCDQRWQFEKVNNLLKDQGGERFFVGLPTVMEGYKEELEGPLQPQVSEGVGITVNCKDPVGAFKYLDFLCSEEAVRTREWGFEGDDYLVDDEGYFYRTPEQIQKWQNEKWKKGTFGQIYWIEICGFDHGSVYSDGKNAVDPRNQPSFFYGNLREAEKEVLNAYGKKTWFDFYNPPDNRRAKYFPLWTVKIPTGSDIDIAHKKIFETRRKYTPLLIMAAEGEYDKVWNEYMAALAKIPNQDTYLQFYQDQLDKRVEQAGGY